MSLRLLSAAAPGCCLGPPGLRALLEAAARLLRAVRRCSCSPRWCCWRCPRRRAAAADVAAAALARLHDRDASRSTVGRCTGAAGAATARRRCHARLRAARPCLRCAACTPLTSARGDAGRATRSTAAPSSACRSCWPARATPRREESTPCSATRPAAGHGAALGPHRAAVAAVLARAGAGALGRPGRRPGAVLEHAGVLAQPRRVRRLRRWPGPLSDRAVRLRPAACSHCSARRS